MYISWLSGKMFRKYSLILILTIGLAFQGCIARKTIDNSSERKTEIYKELKKIKVDVERLQKQIDTFKESGKQLRIENEKELARVIERNQLLNQELNRLKADNETLKKILLNIQVKVSPAGPVPHKVEKNIEALKIEVKIKVLSGDGNPEHAIKMAEKLKKFGYKIESIGRAPRSNFKVTTIYFKPNVKNEVKRLVSKLNVNHILKPLSWSSDYNIIVVTSKNKKATIKD